MFKLMVSYYRFPNKRLIYNCTEIYIQLKTDNKRNSRDQYFLSVYISIVLVDIWCHMQIPYYLYTVKFEKKSFFDSGFKLTIHCTLSYICEHGEGWLSLTGSLWISYTFPHYLYTVIFRNSRFNRCWVITAHPVLFF